MSIFSPELIILQTIKSIIKLIRDDATEHSGDETKTILYKMLNGAGSLERYGFYTQAKKLLITNIDDPRSFDVSIFFNAEKSNTPHLHITLPNETSGQDGIGIDEGNEEESFDQENQTFRKKFTRRWDARYNLTVTSNNSNEVLVLYHFIRAILIPVINHLEGYGLEHIKISGGDLNINSALIPPNVFMRNIALNLSYDWTVEDVFDHSYVEELVFKMHPTTIVTGFAELLDDDHSDSDSDSDSKY